MMTNHGGSSYASETADAIYGLTNGLTSKLTATQCELAIINTNLTEITTALAMIAHQMSTIAESLQEIKRAQ